MEGRALDGAPDLSGPGGLDADRCPISRGFGWETVSNSQFSSMSIAAIRDALETPLCYFDGSAKFSTMFRRQTASLAELVFSIFVTRLPRRFCFDGNEEEYPPSKYRNLHEQCSKDWERDMRVLMRVLECKPSTARLQLKYLLTFMGVTDSARSSLDLPDKAEDEEAIRSCKLAISLSRGDNGVDKDVPQAVQLLNKLIDESGLVSAMRNLADMFTRGDGVEKNVPRAVMLYKRAIDEGQCVHSMHQLATLFEKGEGGLPKDLSRAVQLYLRAINENRYTPSMLNLAFLLAHGGKGVEKDACLAVLLYEVAIEESQSTHAMHELAVLLENGEDGVQMDLPRARDLYNRAIDEGQMASSLCNLGLLYLRVGTRVKKYASREKGLALLRRAIEGGNIQAMHEFALILEKGEHGMEKDVSRAVALYSRAVDGGNTYSMYQLAFLLASGKDRVKVDLLRAAQLYARSIIEGNTTVSMYNLGLLLMRDGAGVSKNQRRAVELFTQVIIREEENIRAMCYLADLLLLGGERVEQDLRRAKLLYERAIDKGQSTYAMHQLAFLLETGGPGVEKNLQRAIRLYMKASYGGNSIMSMNNLGVLLQRCGPVYAAEAVKIYGRAIKNSRDVLAMTNMAALLSFGCGGFEKDETHSQLLYRHALSTWSEDMPGRDIFLSASGLSAPKQRVAVVTRAFATAASNLLDCKRYRTPSSPHPGIRFERGTEEALIQASFFKSGVKTLLDNNLTAFKVEYMCDWNAQRLKEENTSIWLVAAVMKEFATAVSRLPDITTKHRKSPSVQHPGVLVEIGAEEAHIQASFFKSGVKTLLDGFLATLEDIWETLMQGRIAYPRLPRSQMSPGTQRFKHPVTRDMFARRLAGENLQSSVAEVTSFEASGDKGYVRDTAHRRGSSGPSQPSVADGISLEASGDKAILDDLREASGNKAILDDLREASGNKAILDDLWKNLEMELKRKYGRRRDYRGLSHPCVADDTSFEAPEVKRHLDFILENLEEGYVRETTRRRKSAGTSEHSVAEGTSLEASGDKAILDGVSESLKEWHGHDTTWRRISPGRSQCTVAEDTMSGDLYRLWAMPVKRNNEQIILTQDLRSLFLDKETKRGWNLQTQDDRVLFVNMENKSFIVFMCDFFMAYDDDSDLLLIMVPLSKAVVVSPNDLSMNKLLDEVPGEQVQFIARRLVQLTSISWDYDCLAHLEQNLSGAKKRLAKVMDLFDGKSLDLGPCCLDSLAGCEVGFVNWNILDLPYSYDVGLELSGTVIGLSRGDGGVANPEVLLDSQLTFDISITDYIDISIGGNHDAVMSSPDVEENAELNLSFMPQNLEFQKLRRKPYDHPEDLEQAFLDLGYGKKFSAVLRRTATTHFSGKTLTLESVQRYLLQQWSNISHYNLVPLTFDFSGRQILRTGEKFLVNKDGKLHMATSPRNVEKNLTVGINTDFLFATASRSSSTIKFCPLGEVRNLLDAAEHVHGTRTGFEKPRGQGNWYKVHKRGMSDILGALTFVSLMLKGKVLAEGEFKGCVPTGEALDKNGQPVDFNIPVPYGVAYSTFADGMKPNSDVEAGPIVYCLNGKRWDLESNYAHPAVLAGPEHSKDVHSALFDEDSESVADEAPGGTGNRGASGRSIVRLFRRVRGARVQNGGEVGDINAYQRNLY